jgi:hypothetical protein
MIAIVFSQFLEAKHKIPIGFVGNFPRLLFAESRMAECRMDMRRLRLASATD